MTTSHRAIWAISPDLWDNMGQYAITQNRLCKPPMMGHTIHNPILGCGKLTLDEHQANPQGHVHRLPGLQLVGATTSIWAWISQGNHQLQLVLPNMALSS